MQPSLQCRRPRTSKSCSNNASKGGLPLRTFLTLEPSCKDEARVGQKNTLPRRWARRGSPPPPPHDQRTEYAYIFGAICPQKGVGAGLVLPRCNARAMNAHLAEISLAIEPGAHAVLMLDGAGWHIADDLLVPDNITLLPLPPALRS